MCRRVPRANSRGRQAVQEIFDFPCPYALVKCTCFGKCFFVALISYFLYNSLEVMILKKKILQMTPLDRILFLAQILISAAVIVFSVLQLLGFLDVGQAIAIPLLGVLELLQGVREWKKSRGMAAISFAVAVFVFACTAAVWFL